MNECTKYKSDKIINKILKNHFQEFREKKWHRVRKEMRELLKKLQDEVYKVVSNYYENKIKGNHQVGLIDVVHTFGSDLKWNPHIHGLFTEGGIDKSNKWFKKYNIYHTII